MKILKNTALTFATILALGFLIPEGRVIPVMGATSNDWNKDTFWYEPWGASGVHKGMDIFAGEDTPIIATTNLMILYKGSLKKRGQCHSGSRDKMASSLLCPPGEIQP